MSRNSVTSQVIVLNLLLLDAEQIERYFKSMNSVEFDKSKMKSKSFEMEDSFIAFKIYPDTFTLKERTGNLFSEYVRSAKQGLL